MSPADATAIPVPPTGDGRDVGHVAVDGRHLKLLDRANLLIVVALIAGALAFLIALQDRWRIPFNGISDTPLFVYQADALLHGHWDIALSPAAYNDVIVLHGKSYTIYPPMPALLLLPFVALFGVRASDILFTSACSAINLGLLYLLFEQVRLLDLAHRSRRENVIIAALLWVGSINLFLSLGGDLWFTAHIVGLGFALLALLAALRRRLTWSAVLLACGFFTRGTLLLAFPLVFFLALQAYAGDNLFARVHGALRARRLDWRSLPWRGLTGPTLVLALALALFLWRNATVFGSPFESGYNLIIRQRYPQVKDGVFSLHYLWPNLLAYFFRFPQVSFNGPFDRTPRVDFINGGYGVSVFVTTPLFLLLFWRNRRFHPLRAALWCTVALIVLSVLLFHATGWRQFGARYLFEAYPFAFLLLVLSDIRTDWRFYVLGLLGVVVSIAGASQYW